MNNWIEGLPTKEGNYWFYGYRFGKGSLGLKRKPKYILIRVNANGIVIGDGQFIFENEVEEAYHMILEFPEPPYGAGE